MNFHGLLIGMISFFVIGMFHPLVVKAEYHFSSGVWPVFLVAGIVFGSASVFIPQELVSDIFALVAFSALWSIGELKEQKKRVEKGWFPKNPRRDNPL